jgi:hypothetical protein
MDKSLHLLLPGKHLPDAPGRRGYLPEAEDQDHIFDVLACPALRPSLSTKLASTPDRMATLSTHDDVWRASGDAALLLSWRVLE